MQSTIKAQQNIYVYQLFSKNNITHMYRTQKYVQKDRVSRLFASKPYVLYAVLAKTKVLITNCEVESNTI